jgi:hypothetical protein
MRSVLAVVGSAICFLLIVAVVSSGQDQRPRALAPSDYFPLAVGNYWHYEHYQDTSEPGPDRELFEEVVGDTIFGIPGETVSFRVERSEHLFGHADTHTFRIIYCSYTAEGHVGSTAGILNDSLMVFDSLAVYLRNPITVGDSTIFGDVAGYRCVYTVLSVTDTLDLALGRFVGCLRVHERCTFEGQPSEENDVIFIPRTYCPISGEGARHSKHWYSFPDSVGYRYSYLVEEPRVKCCLILHDGDVNMSGAVTAADIIYMVQHVLKDGAPPQPCAANGDVNCSGANTAADIIYLVQHVFKDNDPPCDICHHPDAMPCVPNP